MIATLPTLDSTTASSEAYAEYRDWDFAQEAFDMPRNARTTCDLGGLSYALFSPLLDDRVMRLIQGDYEDGPESLMGNLQSQIRKGDRRLADQLAGIARSQQYDAEVRSLALETLVAARVRFIESLAADTVRVALEGPNQRLQFAGIAAVSDLSRRYQIAFGRVIRELVDSPNSSPAVKRAGAAFLRRRL